VEKLPIPNMTSVAVGHATSPVLERIQAVPHASAHVSY
jgi:hypothetical protein